ncbi:MULTISPECIES: hypothetical protein [Elizabethkingia]|uniref:Lipoprotein n=1 Tax=Elizabethkingia ursingii TaxID=1756150 RepID=A0ABX3N7K7_9FLAO|nr:hypothetical protein [Elizabethkingia ursingii]OPB87141.1 hypothetical protein BB021_11305 [Elizabethkingia ursingii]
MKAYLFTALLGLSALSSCKATSNTSYTEGPVITLKMGEEKSLQKEKLKIKFVDVPEDSRCPMNARCIWIGNARIKLKVNNQTLILDTQDMPDRKYAKTQILGGYRYTLESIQPDRVTNIELKKSDYSISVRVEKVSKTN